MKLKKDLMARSLRRNIILILIFLMIGIAAIAICFENFVKYCKGPVDFEKLSVSEMEGEYAELDVYYNYGGFMEEYMEENNKKEKTTSVTYCIPVGKDEQDYYEGFGAITVAAKNESKMERIAEATIKYLQDENATLTEHILLKGIVKKMDSGMQNYLKRYLISIGYTNEEAQEMICPYVLDTSDATMGNTIVGVILGIGLILIGVIWLLVILLGWNQGKIKKVIRAQGQFGEEEADADYENGAQLTKSIRVGKKYTYILRAFRPMVLLNDELLWIYYGRTQHYTNGIKSGVSYTLNYGSKKGKLVRVGVKSEEEAKSVLEYYDKAYTHIVLGYSKELENTFKNREEFMNIRYNQSRQEDLYGEYHQD